MLHISFSSGTFLRAGGHSPNAKKFGSWTREATLPVKELKPGGKRSAAVFFIGSETSFQELSCSSLSSKYHIDAYRARDTRWPAKRVPIKACVSKFRMNHSAELQSFHALYRSESSTCSGNLRAKKEDVPPGCFCHDRPRPQVQLELRRADIVAARSEH